MLVAYRTSNSLAVESDEVVTDFRGKDWIFVKPVRPSTTFYSGKVMVKDENENVREFYDTVFQLIVEDIEVLDYDATSERLGNGTFAA